MRMRDIYERYGVSDDVMSRSLSKAAFVARIRHEWVGQAIDWSVLTKAALFGDLGNDEITKTVRKKIGLDKFTVSVIDRGVIGRAYDVLCSHDVYQHIYLYCTLVFDSHRPHSSSDVYTKLKNKLSHHVLSSLDEIDSNIPEQEYVKYLDLDIKHYKNPSV